MVNFVVILCFLELYGDWVCFGIMLYGLLLFFGVIVESFGFKFVMSLYSKLIVMCNFKFGDIVGYGCIFMVVKFMCIGVVVCGYVDGYLCYVLMGMLIVVNGVWIWILGWVFMDKICVDFELVLCVEVGVLVLLWGIDGKMVLFVDEVVVVVGMILYEFFCVFVKCVLIEEIGG